MLVEKGYEEFGEERMFNGMTGQFIDVKIFMGFAYYQRLQKFVNDEIFSSASSVTCALTRQPIGGRSKKGGLRIGEMEKDVLCAAGSMLFLINKLMTDSDGYNMYVCRNCGQLPLVNLYEQIYICHTCRDNADIAMVRTKWASKLFVQELNGMGIGIKFMLRPFTFDIYEPNNGKV
jgi:DNA-directed RNA polymerase beta subunit